MSVWELRCAKVNDFASLVISDHDSKTGGMFATKGASLHWEYPPVVEFYVEPQKRKQKPRADVILFKLGALVLNARAKAALGPFLSKFGQLLEMRCGSEALYFYNVVNTIDCVDVERSEKRKSGAIAMEAFDESNVPAEPSVFKDRLMAPARIYVNDAGLQEVERIVAENGLTGIECGSPQRF